MLNGNNEKQLNRIINTDPASRRLFFGVFVLFGFAFVVSFVTNPDKQETCDSNFNSTDTSLSFHPESYDSIDIYQLTHNNWWQLNSIISLLRCRSSRTRAHAIVNDKWILVSVLGSSFFSPIQLDKLQKGSIQTGRNGCHVPNGVFLNWYRRTLGSGLVCWRTIKWFLRLVLVRLNGNFTSFHCRAQNGIEMGLGKWDFELIFSEIGSLCREKRETPLQKREMRVQKTEFP